jgi:hypothetical protein
VQAVGLTHAAAPRVDRRHVLVHRQRVVAGASVSEQANLSPMPSGQKISIGMNTLHVASTGTHAATASAKTFAVDSGVP